MVAKAFRQRSPRITIRRVTSRQRSSARRRCSTWSTAICVTPTCRTTGSGRGRTGSRTIPGLPATGRGCPPRVTTRMSLGNGPIGFAAYQAYFGLPDSGSDLELRGLWYAFTAGSVRVDQPGPTTTCASQDGGNFYVRGYSGGTQRRWLEKELDRTRADRGNRLDRGVHAPDRGIHCRSRSTALTSGIREDWLPLFDRYNVDLVVCGHEHHYERTYAVRGHAAHRYTYAESRGESST